VEDEDYNCSSKEIYSLYAMEKTRLSTNSQAPDSKPKFWLPKIPLYEL